jgi:hypothetical protein
MADCGAAGVQGVLAGRGAGGNLEDAGPGAVAVHGDRDEGQHLRALAQAHDDAVAGFGGPGDQAALTADLDLGPGRPRLR